jgi:hypothetical protein
MNKVIVIAPSEIEDIFLFLSFIQALDKEISIEDISLIYEHAELESAFFLLKKIRLIKRSAKDLGLLESIRFANKLHEVFNTTHVFNQDNSLGAISLAKSFKARHCLGLKGKITNLIYEKEFQSPSLIEMGDYLLDKPMERGVYFEDTSEFTRENFFKESTVEPFLFVAIDEFDANSFILIEQILSSLSGKKIIFWSAQSCNHSVELLQRHSAVVDASEVPERSLFNYIRASFGVVSDRRDMSRLSNYFLKENFCLLKKKPLVPNPLMVNKTVSILFKERHRYLLDYSNGESEEKDDTDSVVNITLSLLKI